jgi:DNA processing protein
MNELLYQLALTLVPNIGDVQAKILIHHLGQASSVFKARKQDLEKLEGIGEIRAASIKQFKEFDAAEKEMAFIEKHQIQTLFLTDANYPQRLLHCADSPTLLFYKGQANLNASRIIAVVGTRHCSEYGRQFTEDLIHDLSQESVLVVSGLAYGIDSIAHRAALKENLPTIGVVGHGLDSIYPLSNAGLAREMIKQQGGLLTEFFSGTKPDKHHFPLRNRIVAGMSDATIVVETNSKGGSMITAKLANAYNRDVFAVPGRVTDKNSTGCHELIQHNKAMLLTNAEDLLQAMGWKDQKKQVKKQTELFIELTTEERMIVDLLQQKENMHIDEMNLLTALSTSTIAAAILNLELQNVIISLPGKRYKLR